MKLSIIIPVYNEEMTIKQVIENVRKLDLGKIEKEIIVVNDASTDQTQNLVYEQQTLDPKTVKTYLSIINLGKGAAVRFGFQLATGDILIIQDADLELDIREYPKLLEPILSGKTQVVYGTRFGKIVNKNIPLKTILANKFLATLTNILFGGKLTDMETAYKVMSKDVLNSVKLRSVEFDFEAEITAKLIKNGFQIYEVPIHYRPRTEQEGKKMNWRHGVEAVYSLLKYRFFD